MANITVRTSTTATDPSSTSAKGSALSHTELDSNFILLNNEKLENTGTSDYTGDLQIKGSGGSTRGSTRFFNNDDSKYIELKAPATITSTTSFTLPAGDGANGQALITNGSGALTFGTVGGGGSSTQSTADSNFQLATNSDLDVNGNKIISTSNGDIDIEPNGTGDVLLGNFKFDVDQTVGSSQDNFVLTYDNSSGKISLEAATGGITASSTDTLTNKSLTAPILTGSSSSAGSILFKEDTDNGTNAVTLIGPASTADVTVTLPASTDTLVGKATTDTLTNKTLTSPSIAGGTVTSDIDVNDDTKIKFGNDADGFVRWRNSKSSLEANIDGNLMINVSDSGASGKGNCRIRTDNKLELEAGKDRDSTGDLLLTSFDDFQFRKNGFASTDTDLSPTTAGSTSVVLGRALTTGEQNAFNDFALFFFDGDPTSSSQLRDMSRYLEVDADTAITGSGATTTITLYDAVSNLSNATHSAGKYLQTGTKSPAVVVDGTRGRLEDKQIKIQNRLGFEQPVGMALRFEAIEFHDGGEYLGTGTGQSDEAEERPIQYDLETFANQNQLKLSHSTCTAGSFTTTDVLAVKGRSNTTSTVASKTAPDTVEFNLDIDAQKTIVLHNQSGDPSGIANASHIYAKDESSSSEVFVRDEAGNVNRLSSHNEDGEWEYYSYHKATGKRIKINMEEMIRDIEKLTGKNYIRNV